MFSMYRFVCDLTNSSIKLLQSYTQPFNFQETFVVNKLSNGANPESRHCVVCAVALMEKRRRKEEDEQFPKLAKHIRYA